MISLIPKLSKEPSVLFQPVFIAHTQSKLYISFIHILVRSFIYPYYAPGVVIATRV